MKEHQPTVGLSKLCWLFGITRQAYYQGLHQAADTSIEEELVIKEVRNIRASHPKIGTRKLYIMMEEFMYDNQIKMGRDALFNLLSVNNLLIRRRRRSVKTTQSHHWLKKFPNLIKGYIASRPNELYVSDITYWKIEHMYVYIHLITDAYSHKIVGYHLSDNLEADSSIQALKMALTNLERHNHLPLTHHSDRGVQYCSSKYVKILQDNNIQISMTENGDPLENAIAERVNGILKEEYLMSYSINDIKDAKELLADVIELYNKERPHMSNGNIVPEKVHNKQIRKGNKCWKNYYQKKCGVNQF
jgi:putative transposase